MILDVVPGLIGILAVAATLFLAGVGVGLLVGRLRLRRPDNLRAAARDTAPAAPAPAGAAELVLWPHLHDPPATRAWERSA